MGSKTLGKSTEGIRALYIDWCKVPADARKAQNAADKNYPATRRDFAKKYHVDRTTLWRWEQDPDFKREVANEALGLVSADELGKMIAVMKAKALDGNVPAFNAIMKLSGLSHEGAVGFGGEEESRAYFSSMSEEELAALAAAEDEDEGGDAL